MLYDNLEDPYQMNNLVAQPDYEQLQKRQDEQTEQLLSESGESGDPMFYAKLIQSEREARDMPDRWHELWPERIDV
jgi:hypothetical protein